jgi:hypothetical protein
MEIPGTGHGRNMVENFMQDPHSGHPSPRLYTPIGAPPPTKKHGQNASGGGGAAQWGGVGVGPSWSVVSSCNPVSDIQPIPPKIYCRTSISATHPRGPIRPLVPPPPSRSTTNNHASGGMGTAPWGGVEGGAALEFGVLM